MARQKPQPAVSKPPRKVSQLSPTEQDARRRALDALTYMRTDGRSLRRAASLALTTPRTVRKYAASAIRRDEGGRYAATPSDRLARTLHMLTPEGKIEVTVYSSRTASRIAAYWAAVDHYLKTGETERLRPFRGKAIRSQKVAYPFITDPRILERLGNAGEVSFEDLYARAA